MKNLAIIPARGGSKRLPRKNVLPVAGKPLVCHSIEAAIKSNCFSKIIVSSEDNEILKIASSYGGIVVPDKRPENLAGDFAKAREVVWEIIDRTENDGVFDTVTLMLPTAPHRKKEDIISAFKLMDTTVDGVISMEKYDMTPMMGATVEEGLICPLFKDSPLLTGNTRSQDHKPIYRPNGVLYINWWSSLKTNRIFFKGKVRALIMDSGVDIDTKEDLLYLEFLVEKGFITLGGQNE